MFAQPRVFQQPGMATVLAQSLSVLPSWFQWQAVTAGGSVALLLLSRAKPSRAELQSATQSPFWGVEKPSSPGAVRTLWNVDAGSLRNGWIARWVARWGHVFHPCWWSQHLSLDQTVGVREGILSRSVGLANISCSMSL